MTRWSLLALAFAVVLVAGCGGGNNGLQCSLDDQTVLASSEWPSFRRDSANTARTDAVVGTGHPTARCVFPRATDDGECIDAGLASSPIETSVIIGGDRLVFATRDGDIHFLQFDGTPLDLPFDITINSGITTPLLGADGSLYVTSGDGAMRRFDANAELQATGTLLSFISATPVIDSEGVIYTGTVGGSLAAVCPNGGLRFNLPAPPTRGGAAITTDPLDDRGRALILSGGDSGRVLAVHHRGDFRWSFTASSSIFAPIVIDEERAVFFVLDRSGRIYSGNLMDGTGISSFRAARCSSSDEVRCNTSADCPDGENCVGESITAAAALGAARLYVGTEGNRQSGGSSPGRLYALDVAANGALAAQSAWEFPLPTNGTIRSSPAVAQSCNGDLVLFGADLDDCGESSGGACGALFAVDEAGLQWSVELQGLVGTNSPTIRADAGLAVAYVGTDAGRLYAIQPPLSCTASGTSAR
jgi:outer membrane protein assembly factor BamB